MLERVFSVMPPAAALACSAWAAGDLGEPVKTGSLWKLPESEVIRQYLAGEPYAPIDESSIRVRSQGRITFGGLQPREIELTWKDGRLGSILVMVYNKGDDGPLDKDSFEKKVSRTVKELDELTGVPGKRKRVSRRESAVEVNAWEWVLPEETGGGDSLGSLVGLQKEELYRRIHPPDDGRRAGGRREGGRRGRGQPF